MYIISLSIFSGEKPIYHGYQCRVSLASHVIALPGTKKRSGNMLWLLQYRLWHSNTHLVSLQRQYITTTGKLLSPTWGALLWHLYSNLLITHNSFRMKCQLFRGIWFIVACKYHNIREQNYLYHFWIEWYICPILRRALHGLQLPKNMLMGRENNRKFIRSQNNGGSLLCAVVTYAAAFYATWREVSVGGWCRCTSMPLRVYVHHAAFQRRNFGWT